MREKLLSDLKIAMKNQQKEVLAVIRSVKGAMQLEEINKKHELNDEEMIDVLAKQIKIRKESIIEFEKGNRNDLVEITKKELDILSKYMPEQLSKEELIKIIDETFLKIEPKSISDMGKIMKEITPIIKGKADMSEVSKMIKERL